MKAYVDLADLSEDDADELEAMLGDRTPLR